VTDELKGDPFLHYIEVGAGKDTLTIANLYYKRGWSVIPLGSPAMGMVQIEAGKVPAISWETYQVDRATPVVLTQWFYGENARYNIGIVTGKVSQLVVIDIDANKGGFEWLNSTKLISSHMVRTGGGGYHLYFHYTGPPIGNRVRLAEGVDVRAEGGQVAAPPSLHHSGHRYTWITEDGGLPIGLPTTIPEWLEKMLSRPVVPATLEVPKVNGEGRAIPSEVIEEVVNFLLPFYESGSRHEFQRAIQGFLAKRNYRFGDVREIVQLLMTATSDTGEIPDRIRLLQDTYEAVRKGKPVAGQNALEQLIGEENVKRVLAIFGTTRAANVLEVLPARDFTAKTYPSHRWLIQDLLPVGGMFMLSGHPGAGKTALALQLSLHLGAGRDFLDRYPVPHAVRVLYMQADNPAHMMQRMVNDMLKKIPDGAANLLISNVVEPVKINTPEGFDIMAQTISLYRPQVVVLDTIRDFHSADENNPTAVAEMMDALKRLRSLAKDPIAVGYLHHMSKSSGSDQRPGIEKHMGSMRFVTPVDLSMSLTFSQAVPGELVLAFPKIRWAPPRVAIRLKREAAFFTTTGQVAP
jgi:hypothetical protein